MNERQNPWKDDHTFPSVQEPGKRAKQSNILLRLIIALAKYFWPGNTDLKKKKKGTRHPELLRAVPMKGGCC